MRATIAAAAIMLAAAPAYADVTYTWVGDPPPAGYETPLSFTVSDAVVASGSMSFSACNDSSTPTCTPWPSYFSGLDANNSGPPTGGTINVTFNPDGTLSGTIVSWSTLDTLNVSGSEYSWGGQIGDELAGLFSTSGYWLDPSPLPVPEPSSLALMLSAIGATIGLGLRRKRPASSNASTKRRVGGEMMT